MGVSADGLASAPLSCAAAVAPPAGVLAYAHYYARVCSFLSVAPTFSYVLAKPYYTQGQEFYNESQEHSLLGYAKALNRR
jgi:hypothetical protein